MNVVSALDFDVWKPVVVLRKDGPAVQFYRDLGVEFIVEPHLPSFRPSERKNWISYLLFLWSKRKIRGALNRIETLARKHDCQLVHVNHESLALAGRDVARRLRLPWICHIRTQLIPGFFARRLAGFIAQNARHIVYISEPVQAHFHSLLNTLPSADAETVLYNICLAPGPEAPAPDSMAQHPGSLKIISLSNFSPNRGVDRIVDIAAVLKQRGESGIQFFLFGKPAHSNPLTGQPTPYYGMILSRIAELGLSDSIHLPGHLANPEGALNHASALIKLTRQQNPWGRDIMEGIAAGIPVITLGTYDKFVAMGENGYLAREFDAENIADYLISLRDDVELRNRIQKRNTKKAKALFGPGQAATTLSAVYSKALEDHQDAPTQ